MSAFKFDDPIAEHQETGSPEKSSPSPPKTTTSSATNPRSRPGFPHRVHCEPEENYVTQIDTKPDASESEHDHKIAAIPGDHDQESLDASCDSLAKSIVSDTDHHPATTHHDPVTVPLDEEANDTDQETDRLLDQLHLESEDNPAEHPSTSPRRDSNFRVRTLSGTPLVIPHHHSPAILRHGIGTALSANAITFTDDGHVEENPTASSSAAAELAKRRAGEKDAAGRRGSGGEIRSDSYRVRKNGQWDPELLIAGVLFGANYLGSTQLTCDGRPTKTSRMIQAEEAVSRIKVPADEHQPSTYVDLCISIEKIMVLNAGTQDVIMDPSLRSISYIADIGDLVVLMARRTPPPPPATPSGSSSQPTTPTPSDQASAAAPAKIICHVFESPDAPVIAQSIGQAFQVAYAEFLRTNGLTDDTAVSELDYQQVLNSQQIFGNELAVFTRKDAQKEVNVEKTAGEVLGLVLVESGWGSLIPTVVVANMLATGAAARSGQLNIGDQLIAVNGLSLVGLPLASAQNFIGSMAKGKRSVRLTVVPCAPVVEVQIRRPDTKFQLGFSVQNGIICSLLRGGIAERGGVRVGHRIIEINDQSVVAVRHEQIVSILASSVGEIRMKTMPTAMFRLLTGQESPTYI